MRCFVRAPLPIRISGELLQALDLDQPGSQCLADAKVPTQQIKQVPPGRADGEVRPLDLALLGAVRRRL